MKEARILSPEEWPRMEDRDISALLPFIEPENIHLVVVEDESGQIVASVGVLQTTHFEGLWIAPEHRGNAGVFRSLIRKAYSIPRGRNEHWAFGGAKSDDERMKSLCRKLGGTQMPIEFFAISVEGN